MHVKHSMILNWAHC